jgi:hypothetical protein
MEGSGSLSGGSFNWVETRVRVGSGGSNGARSMDCRMTIREQRTLGGAGTEGRKKNDVSRVTCCPPSSTQPLILCPSLHLTAASPDFCKMSSITAELPNNVSLRIRTI